MFLRLRQRGQSTLEYAILIIIVMAAFLTTSQYFKRGVQGRWKTAVDELGDQYDPTTTNSRVQHVLASNSVTTVVARDVTNGIWTFREDSVNSVETKSGFIAVGAY